MLRFFGNNKDHTMDRDEMVKLIWIHKLCAGDMDSDSRFQSVAKHLDGARRACFLAGEPDQLIGELF